MPPRKSGGGKRSLNDAFSCSSSSEDSSGEVDDADVVLSGQPVDPHKLVKQMHTRRETAHECINTAVRRLYKVLEEQRLSFVERTPNHPLAGAAELAKAASLLGDAAPLPLLPAGEEKTKRVEEAFDALQLQVRRLVTAIASARIAELSQTPSLRSKPVALAFAVSAPCTSWSVDSWQGSDSGMPRVVEVLRLAFLASFSGPKRTDNRAGTKTGLPFCQVTATRSTKLCYKRVRARKRMDRALKSLVVSMGEFRERFVKKQSHHPLAFADSAAAGASEHEPSSEQQQKQEGQEALDAAYGVMDAIVPDFLKSLADARSALLAVDPAQRFRPAVVVFSVEAPGTSWDPRTWHNCAFPRMVPLLQQVFLAAFSSQIASENQAGGRGKKTKDDFLQAPPSTDTEVVADAASYVAVAASAHNTKTKRVKTPLGAAAI